ncbi:hypothetical protein EXIGLDRAFT_734772 [Exidia glandulosa HHB12029]|uniref:Uncharacterized protein n=1 Tax=Exidia glandulosa HHB12029 TaxID=1314781 RepID=A0A166AW87_EXIGL|nr:hypothetical protein EXIGLDRAFT_734772 [Exidia glandulosa HHB12029]
MLTRKELDGTLLETSSDAQRADFDACGFLLVACACPSFPGRGFTLPHCAPEPSISRPRVGATRYLPVRGCDSVSSKTGRVDE